MCIVKFKEKQLQMLELDAGAYIRKQEIYLFVGTGEVIRKKH
jgi:hypothetical protein